MLGSMQTRNHCPKECSREFPHLSPSSGSFDYHLLPLLGPNEVILARGRTYRNLNANRYALFPCPMAVSQCDD